MLQFSDFQIEYGYQPAMYATMDLDPIADGSQINKEVGFQDIVL